MRTVVVFKESNVKGREIKVVFEEKSQNEACPSRAGRFPIDANMACRRDFKAWTVFFLTEPCLNVQLRSEKENRIL